MTMARRAQAYPQVEPGAGAAVDARIASVPPAASVGAALRVARAQDVGVLDAGVRGHVVLRADLARAEALGLADLRAADLARPVPVVDAQASEVRVRRALAAGAPLVLVAGRRGAVGAATRAPELVSSPAMAAALGRRLSEGAQAVVTLAATLAARHPATAYLVGGVVRDLFKTGGSARAEIGTRGGNAPSGSPAPYRPTTTRNTTPGDLDVVVEGDGHRLARELARALGGTLVRHDRFLTASVAVPDVGTVDVITARSERYERPGALPRVMPAGIRQDLERRDFTVNAMAVDLGADDRPLLDPFGGRADLERRRLRVLHPLSFVEDPTRIFRGARYGARLGFSLDAWTARCQRLALGLVPYPALSGARIVAEIARVVGEGRAPQALGRLGVAGVFRLLDPDYRFTAGTARRIADLGDALDWVGSAGLAASPVEITLLALLADQAHARRALVRLGFSGEPLTRLERALDAGPTLPAALAAARTASARAALRDARIDGGVRDRGDEAEYVRRWLMTREEG
jgi:tRNA nucleotidyltransferase/poly(A) polymerase